ncbi:MAG: hypothetical protein AAF726_14030 [Planctomycetota bacterium]
MKRTLLYVALAATTFATSSCIAGPNRISRYWDTWVNQKYSEDSWIHGALLQNIIPAYPFAGAVLSIGDIAFLNPWVFWTEDVWDKRGTAYEYTQPVGAQRVVTGWKPESLDGD